MIRKNKTIVLVTALLVMAGVTSCEVDRVPETAITDASFWKSEGDLKLATNYLYTNLPGLPATQDIWSDYAYGLSPNSISEGSRVAGATDGNYTGNYTAIRAANNIMEKSSLALAAGVNPQSVKWYVAEAKFFRAWAYFNLLQRYGGVPLILKTLQENSPELEAPAASRDEIVNAIYADLDAAALDLRTSTQLTGADYGRISQTAAWAFKARVALFEGTRAKFHGYGDPVKHLTIAKAVAKLVMDSGKHELFATSSISPSAPFAPASPYFNLFQYAGDGIQNKENILVRIYGENNVNSIISHGAPTLLGQGNCNPTKALVDSYLMTDGLPTTKSPLYTTPTTITGVFAKRDPRMSDTFLKKGDAFIFTVPIFVVPDLLQHKTGFSNRRYCNPPDNQTQRSFIDMDIIRYAEVLLIYAEATYELNGSITDADLDLSINKLRTRVGVNMPKLTNTFVTLNGLNMREEIRRERGVELALEGFRYWDLIRWKTAETELVKPILGNFYFAGPKPTKSTDAADGFGPKPSSVILDANGFIVLQDASKRTFRPERDYLWPIPIKELSLNPKLKQNPFWE